MASKMAKADYDAYFIEHHGMQINEKSPSSSNYLEKSYLIWRNGKFEKSRFYRTAVLNKLCISS